MHAIDIHTHAFPDAIAERAVPLLETEGNVKARLDGKLSSLLDSMDRSGIEVSVVASIATRPEQFDSILRWSAEIASDRIVPFPSVHPADPSAVERIGAAASRGFKGIKLHPYYQDFYIDEERMFPIYGAIQETGLVLLLHTGFDMAFERVRRADPERILRVTAAFPRLKLVTTHLGAWEDWEEVEAHFLGKPICTDVSYAIQFMAPERARHLLHRHPRECILFGSDSPWADQKEAVDFLRSLELGEDWERAILYENAKRLLDSA